MFLQKEHTCYDLIYIYVYIYSHECFEYRNIEKLRGTKMKV